MALSQAGIDYICQKFGDVNLCCINTGLSWYYTSGGTDYPESGGTAQIVSRLASGLIDSLTMTNPARGTFTQAQLNTANGGTVTIQDAQTITNHDEPTEDQWCYDEPIPCSSYTNQTDCLNAGCYWWSDGTCNSSPEPQLQCSDYTNQTDCLNAGCYWWSDGTCRDYAEPVNGDEWWKNPAVWIPIAIGAGCALIALVLWKKKK